MEPTDINRRAFDDLHRRPGGQRHDGVPPIVRHTLGDLAGKRVLQLGSGTGAGSAELAELGAVVTAVDPSSQALDAARERWPSILWIEAAADALPAELRRGRFDLVYSGPGTATEVADVSAWARGIAAALHPRGELLVFDEHPIVRCLDGFQHWYADYFADDARRLGRIVTALAQAGFGLEALEEYPGEAAGRRYDRRVPVFFLLYARRVDRS